MPFDITGLPGSEINILADIYQELCSSFNIGLPDELEFVNRFELFNNIPEQHIGGTLLVNYPDTNCYLNFIKRTFSYDNGRGGKGGQSLAYDNYQVWAFVEMANDFGRVLIRKETFADRLLQLIHPVEIKFKADDEFNRKFYVIANDEGKARNGMSPAFRKQIEEELASDMHIEIINYMLTIRSSQPIAPDKVLKLAKFASKLAKL